MPTYYVPSSAGQGYAQPLPYIPSGGYGYPIYPNGQPVAAQIPMAGYYEDGYHNANTYYPSSHGHRHVSMDTSRSDKHMLTVSDYRAPVTVTTTAITIGNIIRTSPSLRRDIITNIVL